MNDHKTQADWKTLSNSERLWQTLRYFKRFFETLRESKKLRYNQKDFDIFWNTISDSERLWDTGTWDIQNFLWRFWVLYITDDRPWEILNFCERLGLFEILSDFVRYAQNCCEILRDSEPPWLNLRSYCKLKGALKDSHICTLEDSDRCYLI